MLVNLYAKPSLSSRERYLCMEYEYRKYVENPENKKPTWHCVFAVALCNNSCHISCLCVTQS